LMNNGTVQEADGRLAGTFIDSFEMINFGALALGVLVIATRLFSMVPAAYPVQVAPLASSILNLYLIQNYHDIPSIQISNGKLDGPFGTGVFAMGIVSVVVTCCGWTI
jgi:hypothetical protein